MIFLVDRFIIFCHHLIDQLTYISVTMSMSVEIPEFYMALVLSPHKKAKLPRPGCPADLDSLRVASSRYVLQVLQSSGTFSTLQAINLNFAWF